LYHVLRRMSGPVESFFDRLICWSTANAMAAIGEALRAQRALRRVDKPRLSAADLL
jgi:hypothetical protein